MRYTNLRLLTYLHKFYVVSGAVFSEDDTNGVRFGPRSVLR